MLSPQHLKELVLLHSEACLLLLRWIYHQICLVASTSASSTTPTATATTSRLSSPTCLSLLRWFWTSLTRVSHFSAVVAPVSHSLGGHFKDAYDQKKDNMIFVDTDKEMTKKAVLEMNYFENLAADKRRRLEVLEKENVVLKGEAKLKAIATQQLVQEVKRQDRELESHSATLKIRYEKIEALTAELAVRTKELEKEKAECSRLKDELQRVSESFLDRFLTSRAFTHAAPLACLDMKKFTVYRELQKIGQVYPFKPEHAGFVEIPAEVVGVKRLPGYKWDQKEDRLIKPDGTVLEGPLKLEDHPPVPLPHP